LRRSDVALAIFSIIRPTALHSVFYLCAAMALCGTEPDGQVSITVSVEQLALGSIKRQEAEAEAKVIEHEPPKPED
jgi:hypothetical protein